MVTKTETKEIQAIIKKHYGKSKRFRNRGWEQCGVEIQHYIDKKSQKFEDLPYSERCDKERKLRNRIQNEYESYFKVNSMYNWINGNTKLKDLINLHS